MFVQIPASKSQLLVSGPGTGKTNYCIELFKSQILKSQGGIDSRSFFILPSREHAERIQHLILKKEITGLFNAHILTINDLTARLLGLSAGERPSDHIRKKILKSILETESLPYFKGVATCDGFLDLLVESMQEFETSLLTLREFERRSQKLLKDEVFRMKFRDISVVRQQYARRLKALGLREPEENIAHLLKKKHLSRPLELVIFDGFYHFTRAQRALIEWLTRNAEQTVVTLTLSDKPVPRPELFEFPQKTKEALMALGFKEKKMESRVNRRTDEPALRHLEENLFCDSPLIFSKPVKAIELLEAPNARAEIEMIADEIQRLTRETAWHYSDMSLILRKIGGYEPMIQAVFKAKGIPVNIHERRKLIQHGFVTVMHRFFKLIREDWRREDLFFILKSSFFEKKTPLEDVHWIENAAFRKNISEGRARWLEILEDAVAPHAVGCAMRDLADWHERFLRVLTPRAFERLLDRLIDDFGMLGFENSDADAQALSTIRSICRSADRVYRSAGRRGFTVRSFIEEFQASLEQGLFSVRPPGKNRVQVYDVVMALPKEYAVVFFAGLLEKSCPQSVTEDALLKDGERRAMNRGGEVLEERLKRIAGERYFFYMGLARAKSRVFLSYPLYDSDGRQTLPSFFVEEARRCFQSLPVCRKALTDFFPAPKLGLPPDNQKAVLRDKKILERFQQSDRPLSATRLEMFAVCPFKYFSAKVLQLNEPLEGREAVEKGILLHKVLEEFYVELSTGSKLSGSVWRDLPATKKRLLAKLDALMKKSPFQNEPLYRQRVYDAQMRAALEAFAEEEKKLFESRTLEPRYFEWPFKITLGGVALEGKIDRVDVAKGERQALVVDYKLSKRADTVGKKLSQNLELQLPLYSLAVKKLLGLDVIGGELRFLKSFEDDGFYRESAKVLLGVHPKRVYPDPDFEAILTRTENLVQGFAARLKAGDISVDSKNCDHCSFSAVCRFEPWRLIYSQS